MPAASTYAKPHALVSTDWVADHLNDPHARQLYASRGVTPDKAVVTYCRIGERSSHTWFVLTYLLGYPSVRNYDGSWTEWGNLVGAPIEKNV